MMKKKDNNLLKPEKAVESYLDSLLHEVFAEPVEVKPLPVKGNLVLLTDFEIPEDDTDQQINETVKSSDLVIDAPQEASETEVLQPEQVVDRHHDFVYPIQCLMFKVSGTQLSIPLIEMGSVLPWVENLTQIPSSKYWSLGVFKHRDRNIRVVDTAGLLSIRNHHADESIHTHILVFGDGDWALSCDSLGKVVKIESDDVQWSGPKTSGLSMGTIKESLALLLDPMKIMKHLESIAAAG